MVAYKSFKSPYSDLPTKIEFGTQIGGGGDWGRQEFPAAPRRGLSLEHFSDDFTCQACTVAALRGVNAFVFGPLCWLLVVGIVLETHNSSSDGTGSAFLNQLQNHPTPPHHRSGVADLLWEAFDWPKSCRKSVGHFVSPIRLRPK